MASIRRPMSADTKVQYDRYKQRQNQNAQTPSKIPGLPKRSEGKEQPQVQHFMKATVTKEVNVNPERRKLLSKAEVWERQKAYLAQFESAKDTDAPGYPETRYNDVAGHNDRDPDNTSPAEQSEASSPTGHLKQPIFDIRKVSRDRIHEQVNERRNFTVGVNGYHIVESQVRPSHRRSPRKKFSESPTSEDDLGTKQGQGEDTDGHRSPSNRGSFALEQRLPNLRGIKTPLKTYAQKRTIAASQGVQIAPGEQPAEDDGDHEDAESESQEDDEDIDEIDIEILQLGKEKLITTPVSQHNANGTVSPRSPKRSRDLATPKTVDRDDDFSPIQEDLDGEDPEQPASKKRRQSSRKIPNVVVRNAIIGKLKGQRASKNARTDQEGRGVRVVKAKGHKSSQKKAPRTLPVNELVTASRRNDDSDEGDDIVKAMEVPEDPILLSEEEPEVSKSRGRKSKTKVSIKWRPGQGFGPIDVSEFRIPQSQTGSANKQSPYSDGFVGKEAEPMGRLMPTRQSNRRQSPTQRVTVRMGQLTLVAETYSDEDVQEPEVCRRRRRKSQKSTRLPQECAHGDDEDLMLIDSVELQPLHIHDQEVHEPLLRSGDFQRNHEVKILQQLHESQIPLQRIDEQERLVEAHESDKMEENGISEPMVIDSIELGGAQSHHEEHIEHQIEEEPEVLLQNVDAMQLKNDQDVQPFSMHEQTSLVAVKIPSPILRTPANHKSCLKQQVSTNRRVSFAGIDPNQREVVRNSTQRKTEASNVPGFLQQLKGISASNASQRAREQEELEVYHQLSMVTTLRRQTPGSESDDQSAQSAFGEESEEEKSGDEKTSDDERELTPAGSSEEEETDAPEEETLDQVAIDEALQHDSSDDEDMTDRMSVNGKHTEMKAPQVVIYVQKPEQLELVATVQSRSTQPDLQQIAREAEECYESGNMVREHRENENVPSHSSNPDGSWRPTQVTEPSSSGVHSENIQPSANCEQIERLETVIQAALIRSEPRSNKRLGEDILQYSENPDSSWKPRQPISSGKLIEVPEDVIDTSPTPVPARQRASSQHRSLSQRHAQNRRHSQPLSLVQTRLSPDVDNQIAVAVPNIKDTVDLGGVQVQRNTGLDSQGSIELGNQSFGHYRSKAKDVDSQGSTILGGSQPLFARTNNCLAPNIFNDQSSVAIPETHFEVGAESDVRESQQSYVPEAVSYFGRASQQLKETIASSRLARTKSTPGRTRMAFFGPGNENSELMAGGITMEEAFAYSPSKTSPVKPSSFRTPARLPTLLEEKSSGQKSLRMLTRQASLSLGTMPGTARKRMMSLPFAPPFKRTPGDEKKDWMEKMA